MAPSHQSTLPFSSVDINPSSSRASLDEKTRLNHSQEPWKYLGYKAFCEWSSYDNDLFILRRFKTLNNRVMLKLQDEICELEEELEVIDQTHSEESAAPVNNGSFRHDIIDRRQEILTEAAVKLKNYNQYVAVYSDLRSRPAAGSHEIQNVKRWLLESYQGAIYHKEAAYIKRTDDLMRVVQETRSPLRNLISKIRFVTRSRPFKMRPVKENIPPGYGQESTFYYNDDLLETFARFLVLSVGLVMLIGPEWLLLSVNSQVHRLAIITAFVTIFLALVSTVSGAKPFESLAATAAYSAVLMVFMQFTS